MNTESLNTFKKILLLAVGKEYKEIIFSENYLPILVSDTKKTYLSGVLPVNADFINNINTLYLSESNSIILNIMNFEFLITKISEDILVRYLPNIKNIETDVPFIDTVSCFKKGLVALCSDNIEKRFLYSYQLADCIVNNRNIHIHILEQNKFFCSDDKYRNITNFYKPDISIINLIKLSEQIPYSVLLIPSTIISETIDILINISKEKLVIVGSSNNCVEKVGISKFSYIYDDTKFINVKPAKPKTHINIGTLINTLRIDEHA